MENAAQPSLGRVTTFKAITQCITEADFALFQRLIEKDAGIFLSPAKKPLLIGRLSRRLRDLGILDLRKYYKRVLSDPEERTRMLDQISTNETHFFREPLHFNFLERELIPRWIEEAEGGNRPRKIRIWSAGCSTGEEPYSIAISLLRHFPRGSGWQIEILATDLSTRVLARAQAGIYPLERAKPISESDLHAFMLRGTGAQAGKVKTGPELQRVVRFEHFNLNDDAAYASLGRFDLIFCRNVLIYFQPQTKARVVRHLLGCLAPNGYLFVGHSESLNHLMDGIRSAVPTVYYLEKFIER